MFSTIAAVSAALVLASADPPPAAAPNPVADYLHAADVNDFSTMGAMMDRGGAAFLKEISNCYLRRVYSDNIAHEIMAVWMCAEGPTRSRVVVANVALGRGGKIAVSVGRDSINDRPAPERTGSAFAP